MNLCAKIGCSTLNDMGGVCGQRNKPTHRETEIWCITVRLRLLEVCLTTKWIWSGLLSPRMVPQHERTKQIKAGGGGINSRKDKKKGKRNRKDRVGEKKGRYIATCSKSRSSRQQTCDSQLSRQRNASRGLARLGVAPTEKPPTICWLWVANRQRPHAITATASK